MKLYTVAILGATGAVGQEMMKILEERNFPVGKLILLASAIYFTITRERLVIHEMAIFIFVTVTTPVTLMLLARATLFRDRLEGRDVPGHGPEQPVED